VERAAELQATSGGRRRPCCFQGKFSAGHDRPRARRAAEVLGAAIWRGSGAQRQAPDSRAAVEGGVSREGVVQDLRPPGKEWPGRRRRCGPGWGGNAAGPPRPNLPPNLGQRFHLFEGPVSGWPPPPPWKARPPAPAFTSGSYWAHDDRRTLNAHREPGRWSYEKLLGRLDEGDLPPAGRDRGLQPGASPGPGPPPTLGAELLRHAQRADPPPRTSLRSTRNIDESIRIARASNGRRRRGGGPPGMADQGHPSSGGSAGTRRNRMATVPKHARVTRESREVSRNHCAGQGRVNPVTVVTTLS